jgi:CBS domain-containing protein
MTVLSSDASEMPPPDDDGSQEDETASGSISYNEFLVEAKKQASSSSPLKIPIPDLLAYWNTKRRGRRIVEMINDDLAREGLQINPALDTQASWESVQIIRLPLKSSQPSEPVGIKIGSLEAAKIWAAGADPDKLDSTPKIPSVAKESTLEVARSLMLSAGIDQLPVISGRSSITGAVSWRSIARAQFVNPQATLRDAIVHASEVKAEDDLLTVIPVIVAEGFAFVRDGKNNLTGVVTTADLSRTFVTLTGPFLQIAEIERRLRKIIDQKLAEGSFTQADLQDVVNDEDGSRAAPQNAADLTIGEYQALLGDPARWERLGWLSDRKVFINALDEVRQIRNDIMHFDPDPPDTKPLDAFLDWLRLQGPQA